MTGADDDVAQCSLPTAPAVKADDSASVRANVLPPFRALMNKQPGILVHADPYHGPFEAYHHYATAAQTWDLDVIGEVALAHGGPVLDIGCGRGRLALALARAGHQVTAVDRSPQSTAWLRKETDPHHCAGTVNVRTGDIRDAGLVPRAHFGVAALADLSINMFADGEAVGELLTAVRRILRPDGVLCLPVLGAGSLDYYSRLRGLLASPFTDDSGRQWLVWIAMHYDDAGPYFSRTLFTQDDTAPDGTLRGHLTAVRERLWTADSLRPHLRDAGLRIAQRRPLRIPTQKEPIPAELLVVYAAHDQKQVC